MPALRHIGPRAPRSPLALAASLLTITALALALALPARADAAPPVAPAGFFGVDINAGPINYAHMAAADIGVTRAVFPVGVVKQGPTTPYNWVYSDQIIGGSAQNGINVIPILYGAPPWISTKLNKTPLKGESKRVWAEYLTALVGRYGPAGQFWAENPYTPYQPITTWQIWNEPNSRTWWGPKPKAKEYGVLLERSAKVIHAVDPAAGIMTAGIVARPTNRDAIPGNDFLANLLKKRAVVKAVDEVAYHPYAASVAGVKKQVKSARKVLRKRHSAKTPIWITEIGWGSVGGRGHPLIKSPTGQNRALRDTMEMAIDQRRKLGLGGLLWYQWRDGTDDLCLWCESSGLVDNRGQPKQLLDTFRSIATR